MNIEELYRQYGEAMVRLEILQSQINNLKKLIAEDLNKPKVDA